MADLRVATAIIQQLGGIRRLSIMLGAHSFTGGPDSLTFKFRAKGAQGINAVKVILDASDTYTVEFWKVRGANMTLVQSLQWIYCDQLRNVVEKVTGLVVRL